MTDDQHNKPGVSTSIDGDCPTFTRGGELYEDSDELGPRITVWRQLSNSEKAFARSLARETELADRESAQAEAHIAKAERTGVLASFQALKASMPLDRWQAKLEELIPWLNGGIEGMNFNLDPEAVLKREEVRAKGQQLSEEGIEVALLRAEERNLLALGSAIADVDLDKELEKIIAALDASISKALRRQDDEE